MLFQLYDEGHTSTFEMLVACLISVRTRDETSLAMAHALFAHARTPAEMSRAFWDPTERLYGLFDVWSFRGFDSVVSSGLGGGSLIYANVLLRKDEHWFVNEEALPGGGYETWPVTRAVSSTLSPF